MRPNTGPITLLLVCALSLGFPACFDWSVDDDPDGGDGDVDGDTDTDVDTDSDTDVDGDTDSDADTDTDVDTDVDGDTDTDVDGDTDGDADGLWRELTVEPSPGGLGSVAMVFDSARGVVVLAADRETWEWDGSSWTDRSDAGTPSPYSRHEMAFHGATGHAILFGGDYTGVFPSPFSNETYGWDGTRWYVYDVSVHPRGRIGHAMAYDATRRETILFGGWCNLDNGCSPEGEQGDTWVWTGVEWLERTPPHSPSPRSNHAMAYDATRGVVVLYGGRTDTGIEDDTWQWDGTDWTEVLADSPPGDREDSAMAFDSARGVAVLVAGWSDGRRRQDTWEWDGSTWTEIDPGEPLPPFCNDHALAFDVVRSNVVLYGGYGVGDHQIARTFVYAGR